MRLQILLGTTVVGCWKDGRWRSASADRRQLDPFKGKRTGVLTWPAQSVGVKLTFQAIVVARKRTFKLRAPVTVRSDALVAPPAREVVALLESLEHLLGDEVAGRRSKWTPSSARIFTSFPVVVLDVLREAAVLAREEEVRVEVGDLPGRFAASLWTIELMTS